MSNKIFSVIYIFILVFLSGCENFQSSSGTVIMDLDAIANATGQAEIIKQQIEKSNQELNSQLNAISKQLKEQLANEKKKLGKKLTDKDKQNMGQLTLKANQKMQQSKALASQKAQQYKATLIQQLQQTIQPIAENIARNRGADIVLTLNNSMMWFNPDVDITDEIIAEMRAQPLAQTNQQDNKSSQAVDKDKQ